MCELQGELSCWRSISFIEGGEVSAVYMYGIRYLICPGSAAHMIVCDFNVFDLGVLRRIDMHAATLRGLGEIKRKN